MNYRHACILMLGAPQWPTKGKATIQKNHFMDTLTQKGSVLTDKAYSTTLGQKPSHKGAGKRSILL